MKKNREGFTLIEMLVVIAIIGALAAVVVLGLGSVRSKARDTKRLADLRQIQNFLENAYKNTGGYPTSEIFFDSYDTSGLPKDPDKEAPYYYCVSIDGTKYIVATMLENLRSESNPGFFNPSPSICLPEGPDSDTSGEGFSGEAYCAAGQNNTFCVSND